MKLPNEERSPRTTEGVILTADWGMEAGKRAVYAADVSSRVVRRIPRNEPWTLAGVLDVAMSMAGTGSAVAAFDVPLGVPESFLNVAAAIPLWRSPSNFVDLLSRACEKPLFFAGTTDASQWAIDRPFFSVPAGDGGLKNYIAAAARHGVDLYRDIDRRTGAKSAFIKSGVPGSVGSAACALWREIGPLLGQDRAFRMWPFEGELPVLRASAPVVLAEMYPRAAYATALLDHATRLRPTLIVAKTQRQIRCAAIEALRATEWVRNLGVTIENLVEAEANEDDFDALMTAAALLRCELEGIPLHRPCVCSDRAEGGILGSGSVNLDLRTLTFKPFPHRSSPSEPSSVTAPNRAATPNTVGAFRCPIPGCEKLYAKTRSGWDAHVGSRRNHPCWRQELESAEERKNQFAAEFPDFFL
jgi:hypothetical protein